MIQVGLLGSKGRMGTLIDQILQREYPSQAQIFARVSRGDDDQNLLQADVVIDVSQPDAMRALASKANSSLTPLPAFIVGSTGWSKDGISDLKILAKKTPVLISSNFSVGVHVLHKILRENATLLKQLGYSATLLDTHHCHKKDSPSGTALSLIQSLAPYSPLEIQTHSIRAGEVIGEHAITFYSTADRIQISHSAQDRSLFARGAIDVALWLSTLKNIPAPPSHILEMKDYFEYLLLKQE